MKRRGFISGSLSILGGLGIVNNLPNNKDQKIYNVLLGYRLERGLHPVVVEVGQIPVLVPEGDNLEFGWLEENRHFQVEQFKGTQDQIRQRLVEVKQEIIDRGLSKASDDPLSPDGLEFGTVDFWEGVKESDDRFSEAYLDQFFSRGVIPWSNKFKDSVYIVNRSA